MQNSHPKRASCYHLNLLQKQGWCHQRAFSAELLAAGWEALDGALRHRLLPVLALGASRSRTSASGYFTQATPEREPPCRAAAPALEGAWNKREASGAAALQRRPVRFSLL